jgi:hypothetical protein
MSQAIDLSGLISGGSSGLMDIVKQLQAAQTAANKANETRYQDILKQYDTLGKAGETRIAQGEAQAQAKSQSSLTGRGLGNTTIVDAMSRGISGDAETSRQQLQEGITRDKTKVMEAKTEQGPDMSMYAQLLAQAGKANEAAKPRTITQTIGSPGGGGFGRDPGGSYGSGSGSSGSSGGGGGNYTPQAPTPSTNSRTPYGQMEGDYGASTASALGSAKPGSIQVFGGDSTAKPGGSGTITDPDGNVFRINPTTGRWERAD